MAISMMSNVFKTNCMKILSVLDIFKISMPYMKRSLSCTTVMARTRTDRKSILSFVTPMDEGVDGEKSVEIDRSGNINTWLPDENTPALIFDGVRFDELPICHINVHKNNTKFALTDYKGAPLFMWTCGCEGFKNAKKGNNIAAQATALTFSMRSIEKGISTIRVKIGGLGPGRMASIKGLQMGGMNIVSISDTTPAPERGPKPRKQRRL